MQGMPRVLKLPTLLELAVYMGYKAGVCWAFWP
jgi:hypothetical protein